MFTVQLNSSQNPLPPLLLPVTPTPPDKTITPRPVFGKSSCFEESVSIPVAFLKLYPNFQAVMSRTMSEPVDQRPMQRLGGKPYVKSDMPTFTFKYLSVAAIVPPDHTGP